MVVLVALRPASSQRDEYYRRGLNPLTYAASFGVCENQNSPVSRVVIPGVAADFLQTWHQLELSFRDN